MWALSKWTRAVPLSILMLIALVLPTLGQNEIIRVNTELVSVPVTVYDRQGRQLTDLRKEDFRVFEDGVEQELAIFNASEQPFTVFLLIDRSGSMANHRPQLTQSVNAFARQLRLDDSLIVATIADDIDLLLKKTKVKDLKKSIKLRQRPKDMWSYIYDGMDDAYEMIKKVPGRKAIILFSDGAGSGTYASIKGNLRKAEETEAAIYTVQFDTFSQIRPYDLKSHNEMVERANGYMRDLPKLSGGRFYQLEAIVDLDKTFSLIADELRQQYSLGYYPKIEGKKGERRQIKVKAIRTDVAVKTKTSYLIK